MPTGAERGTAADTQGKAAVCCREATRADLCLVLFLGKQPGDRIAQLAQRRLHGAADDTGVYAVVMMSEQVTQPRELAPRI
jgi:hypothetical protein